MEKLTKFFNVVDTGQDYLAKNKKIFMLIFTIAIPLYLAFASKVDTINLEIILILAKYTVPILIMVSLTFDFLTTRDIKVWFKKSIPNTVTYTIIYGIIFALLNKFF